MNRFLKFSAARALMGALLFGSTASVGRAAVVTFSAGQTFADSSALIRPTGGYAVTFGNTTSGATVTTSSSADGNPVTFESGPPQTATSSSASGLRVTTNGTGNVTVRNVQGVDDTTSSRSTVRTSGSAYLTTSTTPTAASVSDSGFATAVGGGLFTASAPTATTLATAGITLNNLTVGKAYKVQLFFADARTSGTFSGSTVTVGDGVDTTNTPTGGTSFQYAYGGPDNTIIGAYTIGTFTADATTQTVYANTFRSAANGGASGNGQINALVLQDVAAAAVPEPALAGTALAAAAVLLRGRRRRA